MQEINLKPIDIKILNKPVKTGHLIGSSAWTSNGIGSILSFPLEDVLSIERTDGGDETFIVTTKKDKCGLFDFITV